MRPFFLFLYTIINIGPKSAFPLKNSQKFVIMTYGFLFYQQRGLTCYAAPGFRIHGKHGVILRPHPFFTVAFMSGTRFRGTLPMKKILKHCYLIWNCQANFIGLPSLSTAFPQFFCSFHSVSTLFCCRRSFQQWNHLCRCLLW